MPGFIIGTKVSVAFNLLKQEAAEIERLRVISDTPNTYYFFPFVNISLSPEHVSQTSSNLWSGR
jgi:hypothetical protein